MKHQFRFAASAAAFVLVCAAPAAAQQPLSIEDLFRIEQVGAAAISPDGARVAYTVSTPRNIIEGADDGPPDSSLWIAAGPGQGFRYLSGAASGVAWRPDGSSVTFTARRDGDSHAALYEIPVHGGEARRLYAHEAAIRGYAWAPQGDAVFIIATERADPMRARLAARGFRARVYEQDQPFAHVWRVNIASGEATRLDLPGHASDIAISPDGARIAVQLAPTPLIDDAMMEQRWHVSAPDGRGRVEIATPGKVGAAAFSPDGSQLAFLAAIDRADSIAATLHVADARTGQYAAIAAGAEQHVQSFAWTEDGNIFALVHSGVNSAFVTYSAAGEELSRAPHLGRVARSIDLNAASGRVAVVADAARHPRELFVADAGGDGSLERWTDHNPWLSSRVFGEQSMFRYEARDGVEVEGVLILPTGPMPRAGWPLVFVVHGGPEAHDSDGWLTGYSRPGHIFASRGIAVAYVNYRGSTGRGADFIRLDHADPPGDEFYDLVDAIGYLSQRGLVNRQRVGITGGSYGGFASAWGATIATEHFAVSVPFVALTNLISFHGTTEIPIEMVDVHFIQAPWDDWEMYLDKSPIRHAQGSRTPTLILHGEADTRVDPSQSFELYRYLQQTGEAPVRLILYPGEGHGNRNAAAQYDYALRSFRWLEHYLTGPGGEPPPHELPLPQLLGMD